MPVAPAEASISNAPDLSDNGTRDVPITTTWGHTAGSDSAFNRSVSPDHWPLVWHKIYVRQAGQLAFTHADGRATNADTFALVFRGPPDMRDTMSPGALTAVASDDDSGGNSKAAVSVQVTEAGWFYIAHASYSPGQFLTGQYVTLTAYPPFGGVVTGVGDPPKVDLLGAQLQREHAVEQYRLDPPTWERVFYDAHPCEVVPSFEQIRNRARLVFRFGLVVSDLPLSAKTELKFQFDLRARSRNKAHKPPVLPRPKPPVSPWNPNPGGPPPPGGGRYPPDPRNPLRPPGDNDGGYRPRPGQPGVPPVDPPFEEPDLRTIQWWPRSHERERAGVEPQVSVEEFYGRAIPYTPVRDTYYTYEWKVTTNLPASHGGQDVGNAHTVTAMSDSNTEPPDFETHPDLLRHEHALVPPFDVVGTDLPVASGWRYYYSESPADASKLNTVYHRFTYDDSGLPLGTAPFGHVDPAYFAPNPRIQTQVGRNTGNVEGTGSYSQAAGTVRWMRRRIPAGHQGYRIRCEVDDYTDVWVNEVHCGIINIPGGEVRVPPAALAARQPGADHLVALRWRDVSTTASFLDVTVVAENPPGPHEHPTWGSPVLTGRREENYIWREEPSWPRTRAEMDLYFTPTRVRATREEWLQDTVNDLLFAPFGTDTSRCYRGYVFLHEPGLWRFGFDSDDAADFDILYRPVCAFYGRRASDGLEVFTVMTDGVFVCPVPGWYPFRFRVQSSVGNLEAQLGYLSPTMAALGLPFQIIPAEALGHPGRASTQLWPTRTGAVHRLVVHQVGHPGNEGIENA